MCIRDRCYSYAQLNHSIDLDAEIIIKVQGSIYCSICENLLFKSQKTKQIDQTLIEGCFGYGDKQSLPLQAEQKG